MKLRLILPVILFSSISLISCGGGSDDDGDGDGYSEAVISGTNEEDLAIAATEAAKAAISTENAPSIGLKKSPRGYDLALVQDMSYLCDSGSVNMNINESTGNGVITYSSCNISGAVVNGTVDISTSISGNISTTTVSYNNFTMVYAGQTQSFDMTAVCKTNTETYDTSCSYESDALGIDGRTYSVSNVSVSGNSYNGYSVSATVVDPDHGTLSITTNSPVTFNCLTGQPDSGEIQFTDGDGNSVTVTYTSCTSYTVAYNGVSNTYSW